MNKLKKIILYTLILIVLIIGSGYFWLVSINNYKTNGQFQITKNEKPIEIHRDTYGIPYVFAENKADLIRGQGFVIAQDRLFQIEFYRAFVKGELAGIMGSSMLNLDIKMRVINIPNNAENNYKYLNSETKNFLQWYCDGFNEYLEVGKDEFPVELSLLKMNPKPITPVEVLGIIHFIGYKQAQNLNDEILSLNLASRMTNSYELLPLNINPDRTKKTFPISDSIPTDLAEKISFQLKQLQEPLIPAPKLGSNNWVISGEKSKSGKPIVVNDPHLDARDLPGIFYPIGLFCPDFKAVGVSLPGVPGIMVGRNENVAFGLTNAYGDSQDLFIEKGTDDTYLEQGQAIAFTIRKETIKIKDSEDVEIEVRSTNRGPIISDFEVFGILTKDMISFRWSSATSQSASLGIEELLTAKNVNDFGNALEEMDVMFFNFVYADIYGNIEYKATGLIPQRTNLAGAVPQKIDKEDPWIGFIAKNEMPNIKNPDKGWVGTANHDTRPDDYPYYYSSHFSPNYRYLRIKEVLSENKKFNSEEMWDLMLDCKNKQAEQLTPLFITALQTNEKTNDLAVILKKWNYNDDIDEIGATVYHVLYDKLLNLVLDDELPNDVKDSYWNNQYYWSQKIDKFILEKNKFIDNINTPEKENITSLIVDAGIYTKQKLTEMYGANQEEWIWGKIHTVHFSSPIRKKGFGSSFVGGEIIPKKGSNETINRGGYLKSETTTFETGWFSSFRMVADLNDPEKIRAVLSGGSAARVFHPNYKSQLEAWKNETWIPYWFTKEKVIENSKHLLILN